MDLLRVNKVLFKLMSMRAGKFVRVELNCHNFFFSDHSLSEVWTLTLHNSGKVPLTVKIVPLTPSEITWQAQTATSHSESYGDPDGEEGVHQPMEEVSPLVVTPSELVVARDTTSGVSVRLQRRSKGPYSAALQVIVGDAKLGYLYMFVNFRTAVKGMVPTLRPSAITPVSGVEEPLAHFSAPAHPTTAYVLPDKTTRDTLSLADALRARSSLAVRSALAEGADSDRLHHEEGLGWVSPLHLAALSGSVTCTELLTATAASFVACPLSTPLPVSLQPLGRRRAVMKMTTEETAEGLSMRELSGNSLTLSASLSLGHSWSSSLDSVTGQPLDDTDPISSGKREGLENPAARVFLNDHRSRGLTGTQVSQIFALIETSGERGRESAFVSEGQSPNANGVTRTPLGIGARPGSTVLAVKRLYFRICAIEVLPGSVGELTNMEDLYLRLCPVRLVPATLALCSSLKCLGIDDFRSLEHLPSSINSLAGLQAYLSGLVLQQPVNIARGKVVVVGALLSLLLAHSP